MLDGQPLILGTDVFRDEAECEAHRLAYLASHPPLGPHEKAKCYFGLVWSVDWPPKKRGGSK
jgi:hypothetical protein